MYEHLYDLYSIMYEHVMSSLLHPFTELADATLTNYHSLHRAVMQIEFLAVLWWQAPGTETIILLPHTLMGGHVL